VTKIPNSTYKGKWYIDEKNMEEEDREVEIWKKKTEKLKYGRRRQRS